MTILISDNINFRLNTTRDEKKNTTRVEEVHFTMVSLGSILQENTILKFYAPHNRASQYNQQVLGMKEVMLLQIQHTFQEK